MNNLIDTKWNKYVNLPDIFIYLPIYLTYLFVKQNNYVKFT